MSRKSKYTDLIEEIKRDNPADQWNIKIKAAIAEKTKSEPVDNSTTDPMGINGHTISAFASIDVVREEAKKIVESSRKDNNLISQFVRPGKKKLSKVITDTENGEVYKKFRRNPPVGALVAFINNENLLVGWSKYNKGKEILPFSKKTAVETAVMRGLLDRVYPHGPYDYVTASAQYIPKAVAKEMVKFVNRVEKFFARTVDNIGRFIGTG